MKCKHLFPGIFLLFFANVSLAQDPHFSQFFSSPLTLNPAYTGKFDGDLRISGNYRDQWSTINKAFVTYTLSADFGILKKSLPENDRFGIGVLALADVQANGVLKSNFYSVSAAYHKGLDEDGLHQLSLGFQGVYSQKRLNTTKFLFEDMLRIDGFTGVTNEGINSSNINANYFDLNTGFMFTGIFGETTNYYVGGSIYHITKPKESFTNAQYFLDPRYSIHGGAYFPVTELATIHASTLYQYQNGAQEFLFGGAVEYNVNNDLEYNPINLYAGSWMRWKDAIIPYLGVEFDKFRLGMSYDVNISKLKTASNSRGAFEISLIYNSRRNTEKGINCPKF